MNTSILIAISCAAFFVAVGTEAASAKPAVNFSGTYVAGDKTYQQDIEIRKHSGEEYAIVSSVGSPDCSGYIDGSAKVEDNLLKAVITSELGNTCQLTIERSKRGLTVTEENCSDFHGAACEFQGEFRKKL